MTHSRALRTLYRRVPAFDSLRRYSRQDAKADLVGGLSVAAVAVPQAMAYAMIVGLPAEYGLYTAIVMTTVGALLDSSRQLINGPTNAISIALFAAIGHTADQSQLIQAAIFMAFFIGAIQLAISLAGLGDLTRYISHSVIVGFTTGASLLLVLDQLKNLLGQKVVGDVHDHFLVRFWNSLTEGGPIHGPTVLVGLGSIALVLLLRVLKKKLGLPLLPEFLIVVVLMAGLTAFFRLDQSGVRVVGDIPAKLPRAAVPHFEASWIREFASSALAIALLGLLEAISMAKSIAAVTRQKLDLNQQCLSEACANLAGSFFSCMPGSGSLTRSAINQQAGARTQWAGVISAVAVAVIMVLLAPHARFIPRAALAGLLMLTAARMVNFKDLRYHLRVSRFDAAIVAMTAIAAFAISIEFCVLIGVVLSFMLTVPRTGNMLLTEFVEGEDDHVRERLPEDAPSPEILVFGLEGEMFFGAATSLEHHLDEIERRITDRTRVVVMRMKRARNPDAVGLAEFEHFVERLRQRGVHVLLCGVRTRFRDSLQRSGMLDKLEPSHLFLEQPVRQTSTQAAMRLARKLAGRVDGLSTAGA
ncbi:MAG: SulP family inorganic anion transporter [Planctomycetes bacterium]|nr:SulP family inorganic anion transporter [Planctomycetota bacterium]